MKKVAPMLLAGFLATGGALFGSSAEASENLNPSGGWSESEGYFFNQPLQDSNSITLFASVKPQSHVGKRLTRAYNSSGDAEYAAQGITKWAGKYHYTTAQMQNSKGTVRTTSGRRWGYDYTLAISPYYVPGALENSEARTYWGF